MTWSTSNPTCAHGISFYAACTMCSRIIVTSQSEVDTWQVEYIAEHSLRLEAEARVRELEDAARRAIAIYEEWRLNDSVDEESGVNALRAALETGGEG